MSKEKWSRDYEIYPRYDEDDNSYEALRYRKIRRMYDQLEDFCRYKGSIYDSLLDKASFENGLYYEFLAVGLDEYNETCVDYDFDPPLYYEEEEVKGWVETIKKMDLNSLEPAELEAYNYMDKYIKEEIHAFESEQGALKDKPKELQKKIQDSYQVVETAFPLVIRGF